MPRRTKTQAASVGKERYHAAYHGKVGAPIVAGPASKTSSPAPPKPAVGAGRGFRGC